MVLVEDRRDRPDRRCHPQGEAVFALGEGAAAAAEKAEPDRGTTTTAMPAASRDITTGPLHRQKRYKVGGRRDESGEARLLSGAAPSYPLSR